MHVSATYINNASSEVVFCFGYFVCVVVYFLFFGVFCWFFFTTYENHLLRTWPHLLILH